MTPPLTPYGLARCTHCDRIILARRLYKGRCRDKADCSPSVAILAAMEGDAEDRLEFVQGIERALRENETKIL